MMIPERFFYDEAISSIPNVFQLRAETTGSHFTAIRILDLVSENVSPLNPVLIPLAKLKAVFAGRYKMLDDLYKNLDMMLKTGLIESNNRLDEYSESVDSVKITPYGHYMRHTLSGMFSYLDLISVDTSVHEQAVAHSIARKASDELQMFFDGIRGDRIELRLSRVEEFIEYLHREEAMERDYYSLDLHESKYADELLNHFRWERKRVRASAKRYMEKKKGMDFALDDIWD